MTIWSSCCEAVNFKFEFPALDAEAGGQKAKLVEREIEYMLENEIIQPSSLNWSSPCVMVPKPDGSIRFCTDYRKVNKVTKTDAYPIPRVDDCIDKVGKARYLTKIDLLKGY